MDNFDRRYERALRALVLVPRRRKHLVLLFCRSKAHEVKVEAVVRPEDAAALRTVVERIGDRGTLRVAEVQDGYLDVNLAWSKGMSLEKYLEKKER